MNSRGIRASESHAIGGLFTFLLLAVFLVLALLVVVIGADGYRGIVETNETVGAVRTSLGYVAGKLRAQDGTGAVRLETREGVEALVISRKIEDRTYETVIYHHDGALWELFAASDYAFEPGCGDKLVSIEAFEMAWAAEGLLAFTARAAGGQTATLHVALRAEGGVDG